MLSSLIIARKELIDHLRDSRALLSTGVYTLMGPAVVWLVLLVGASVGGDWRPYTVMAAVFTLLSVFSGSSSVAVDMVAGERERQSLLPLLIDCRSRTDVVFGKWLAASAFGAGSGLMTLLAFVLVLEVSPTMPASWAPDLRLIPNLLLAAPFAAGLQLLVSSLCRNVKEANSYVTLVIFAAIGLTMWLAFSPGIAAASWFLPVAGHLRQIELGLASETVSLVESVVLAGVSLSFAVALVACTGRLFRRDAIVYGD